LTRFSARTLHRPLYTQPEEFTIIDSVLGYHTPALRECYDVRVFLAPTEDTRRMWKVQRDCSLRGSNTNEVLEELDRREADSAVYIRPQLRWADIVVSFAARGSELDAEIILRKELDHPDLSNFVGASDTGGIALDRGEHEDRLFIPGHIDSGRGSEIEEAVWNTIPFASSMRAHRLGELTIGTKIHRSESLAIVQVLILYHLAIAKLAVVFG